MQRQVIDTTSVPKNTGPVKPRNPIEEKEGELVRIYILPADWARLLGEAKSLPQGRALKISSMLSDIGFVAHTARKKKILIYENKDSTYIHYRSDLKGAIDGNSVA